MEEANIEYHQMFNVVSSIRKWLQRDWNVNLVHVYREANFGVFHLAKMGATNEARLQIMEEAPDSMEQIMLVDMLEVPSVRA